MTEYADSTTKSHFDAAKLNLEAARAAAAAVQPLNACHVRDRILTILDEAADSLFHTPAPTLGAIAQKLESKWASELFTGDGEAKHKRILVGDIRRLERVHAGVEEPEASGGMDPVQIASDWTSAQQEYAACERSPDVRAQLLSKRAPDLDAVLKKLELLWPDIAETDRRLAAIVGDLSRFATSRAP